MAKVVPFLKKKPCPYCNPWGRASDDEKRNILPRCICDGSGWLTKQYHFNRLEVAIALEDD